MNPKIFFGELKRRNVYKVAVAYIVAGWALSQENRAGLSGLRCSDLGDSVAVSAHHRGLPVALVLAWMIRDNTDGTHNGQRLLDAAETTVQKSRAWIYVALDRGHFRSVVFSLGR